MHVLLPLPPFERLCDALGRAIAPEDALAEIEAARAALFGPGLLTVNLVAERPHAASPDFQLQRAWSSKPADYPVGGRKRKSPTPWTGQLLVRGEVFVGAGEEALAAVFDDAAKIMAMGLRSVVNVPLLAGGECRATFNVLGPQAPWGREDVAAIRLLALLARPFVLQIAAR
jgi:hypothetical protein